MYFYTIWSLSWEARMIYILRKLQLHRYNIILLNKIRTCYSERVVGGYFKDGWSLYIGSDIRASEFLVTLKTVGVFTSCRISEHKRVTLKTVGVFTSCWISKHKRVTLKTVGVFTSCWKHCLILLFLNLNYIIKLRGDDLYEWKE